MMEDSMNRIFENRKGDREEDENLFDRLSDDLIVCHIFDKMPEAKCLFNCSLVCKRFSSLVYQVSAISLILVPEKPNLAKRFRRWTKKFSSRKYDGFKSSDELCDLKFLCQLMFNFLKNFKDLKYVNIEFDSLKKLRKEPLIKWTLDSQSDSLIMLFAKNLDCGARVLDRILDSYLPRAITRLTVIDLSLLIVRLVSWKQTELQSVVFTFSEKEGTFILDEKAILYMQDPEKVILHRDNPISAFRQFSLRTWYAPKLELPSAGRELEDVMLFVFKSDEMVDDFLIAEKLGEGKEKIYSEAAIEMLKKDVMYQTVNMSETFSFTFNNRRH